MLDFANLQAPADHGQILVVPEPAAWFKAARENSESLRNQRIPLLDSTLAECRRKTRETIVGCDDKLVVVIGHQPGFFHPGVWAKHIVAMRVAAAVDGAAVNLVVDNDAPRRTSLPIPSVQDGRLGLQPVSFAPLPRGHAYEQMARRTPEQIAQFKRAVRSVMGDRYDSSQMPTFFEALAGAAAARDWVDQVVAARRGVEETFGVIVNDRRVSSVWSGPLLVDMLVHAERFATVYNNALAWYRRVASVRGAQRPIPDLLISGDLTEVPLWAYRADEPRRRLFVARRADSLRLFADQTQIGTVPARHLHSCGDLRAVLKGLAEWRLRPRALTLTIWARLLLADLFIHGISGAKYDRISDRVIADYYGLTPPTMACVSATLHMDLPHSPTTPADVQRLRHLIRDLTCNPQRNLPRGPEVKPLIEQHAEAVRRSTDLRANNRRNRQARRATFDEIRRINAAMLAARQDVVTAKRMELAQAVDDLQQNQIAQGREYFFALYDRPRLEALLETLPADRDFRV